MRYIFHTNIIDLFPIFSVKCIKFDKGDFS